MSTRQSKIIVRILILSITMLLFPISTFAGVYWVSPSGTASWANAQSATPLTGAACCSLVTANSNASADDMVYLRGGTYTSQSISPTNSGTGWDHQIIFEAYTGETPTITGSVSAISLAGKDYIKVDGITISNVTRFFWIREGSDNNEVANCTFDTASEYSCGFIGAWSSVESNYNWIHDNTFTKAGGLAGCNDHGTPFRIGYGASDTSNHNVFEDNILSYGGHDCTDLGGKYNVYRNNIIHNEGWMADGGGCGNTPTSGYFGNRCMYTQNYVSGDSGPFLIEGNRLGHADLPPDDDGAFGLSLDSPGCIVRYNCIFNAGASGVYFKHSSVDDNRIYNNTIYYSGQGDADISNIFRGAISQCTNGATGNVSVNNLIYGTNLASGKDYQDGSVPSRLADDTFTNNYLSTDSDPKFTNTSMADKTSLTLPDLSLQSDSPAIDGGTYLTTVSGVVSQTNITLADASYFQDGSWGPSAAGLQADYIAIGTVNNIAQITSINYSTNAVELVAQPASTINVNDHVWLYKKSDGKVVLNGTAPDMGAHEYKISAPKNLRISQ